MAMDQHQLASIAFIRSTIMTTLPASTTGTCHLCHCMGFRRSSSIFFLLLAVSLTINVAEPTFTLPQPLVVLLIPQL